MSNKIIEISKPRIYLKSGKKRRNFAKSKRRPEWVLEYWKYKRTGNAPNGHVTVTITSSTHRSQSKALNALRSLEHKVVRLKSWPVE